MSDTFEARQLCVSLTRAGGPCKCIAIPGKTLCRWHSQDPEDREKVLLESYRGGHAAKPATGRWAEAGPLIEELEIEGLNLETAAGLAAFTAAALRRLAELPLSPRVAAAMAQLATTQRAHIETVELEARLASLETAGAIRRVG